MTRETEQKLSEQLTAIRDKFLTPTPDKDFTDYAIMTRCIEALSAPPAPSGWRSMESIAEFVREYEFRGDGGDRTPSEEERLLIEDALNGYIANIEAASDHIGDATEMVPAAAPDTGKMGGEGAHFGDPCVQCGVAHDRVPVGPCRGDGITICRERADAVLSFLKKGAGPAGWPTTLWCEVQAFIANIEAALSAPVSGGEAVGEAGEMPGSNGGFTMAAFKASGVPLGTKLYTHSSDPAATERMRALDDVAAERSRQIEAEGWTATHDDHHELGELGIAAALYALPYEAEVAGEKLLTQDDFIGLDMALSIACNWSLKPEADRRRRLVKAGALILAEIERLDRAALGEA